MFFRKSMNEAAVELQKVCSGLYFWGIEMIEAISKLLKIVKAPSLRSDKGSVFGCYLAGSSLKLPFTSLCE